MLSQTSRYALHLLGALMARSGERLGTRELATMTGVPANYLSKILNQLAKRGIVDSQKGWGGGFTIVPTALGMPIKEVLAVFEGDARAVPRDCAFGLAACDGDHPCPLHSDWERIRDGYARMVTETTIGQLEYRAPG